MRRILKRQKLLKMLSVCLVALMATLSLWQYRDAEATDIGRGGAAGADDETLDVYSGSVVVESSLNYYEIDYPGSGSKIKIGDVTETSDFKPDIAISTWDGEAEFKLIAPADMEEKSQLAASLSGDVVTALNGEWKFEYKPTEPKEGFNDKGGIDIFITVKEKPASNTVDFTYNSDTVTPYFQPPLTEEYKDGWSDELQADIKVSETQVVDAQDGTVLVERPEHVVNSIAFYADNKSGDTTALGGRNYKAGKVGQLYRMKAVDSKGNWAWLDWSMPSDI